MRVRKFVFDHFREHAAPPIVEQVMTAFSLSREEASDVLHGRPSKQKLLDHLAAMGLTGDFWKL